MILHDFPVNQSIFCNSEIRSWCSSGVACYRHFTRQSWRQLTLNFTCMLYRSLNVFTITLFVYIYQKFDAFSIIFLHPVRKLTNLLRVTLVGKYHFLKLYRFPVEHRCTALVMSAQLYYCHRVDLENILIIYIF